MGRHVTNAKRLQVSNVLLHHTITATHTLYLHIHPPWRFNIPFWHGSFPPTSKPRPLFRSLNYASQSVCMALAHSLNPPPSRVPPGETTTPPLFVQPCQTSPGGVSISRFGPFPHTPLPHPGPLGWPHSQRTSAIATSPFHLTKIMETHAQPPLLSGSHCVVVAITIVGQGGSS